jgi:hypothetical protein
MLLLLCSRIALCSSALLYTAMRCVALSEAALRCFALLCSALSYATLSYAARLSSKNQLKNQTHHTTILIHPNLTTTNLLSPDAPTHLLLLNPMGNTTAKVSDFDLKSIPKYEKERLELRRALILSYVNNPDNNEIVSKIAALKALLIKQPHLCSTAAKELTRKFDYNPTCNESAFAEIDRLSVLYETHKVLKSVQCRIGPVACPMGHFMPFFEDLNSHSMEADEVLCQVCQKSIQSGYHCGYCTYNVCAPCSVVYCSRGHAMKLWTNPEAEHQCQLCHEYPIISGYHCAMCGDNDYCDSCTQRSGRELVKKQILGRMVDDLAYFEAHKHESEIAMRTITTHNLKIESDSYPTILQLYQFSLSTGDIRVVAEVNQE